MTYLTVLETGSILGEYTYGFAQNQQRLILESAPNWTGSDLTLAAWQFVQNQLPVYLLFDIHPYAFYFTYHIGIKWYEIPPVYFHLP